MQSLVAALTRLNGAAFLLLRLMMALIVIVSGYRKLFVAGLGPTVTAFEGFRIVPLPQVAGPFIALLEFGGGILLALGLFTRPLGVLFFGQFVVAWWVKYDVIAAPAGGYLAARLDAMLVVTALVLATQGAGKFSLDAWRNRA